MRLCHFHCSHLQWLVPLALFSSKVPPEHSRAVADKLLTVKPTSKQEKPLKCFGVGFGKPQFQSTITLSTIIAYLSGPDSWFTFHILQLNPQFLEHDIEEWSDLPSYKASMVNLQ